MACPVPLQTTADSLFFGRFEQCDTFPCLGKRVQGKHLNCGHKNDTTTGGARFTPHVYHNVLKLAEKSIVLPGKRYLVVRLQLQSESGSIRNLKLLRAANNGWA